MSNTFVAKNSSTVTLSQYYTELVTQASETYTNQSLYNNHYAWVSRALKLSGESNLSWTTADLTANALAWGESFKSVTIKSLQTSLIVSKQSEVNTLNTNAGALKAAHDSALLKPVADRTQAEKDAITAYETAYQSYLEKLSELEALNTLLNTLQSEYDELLGPTQLNWYVPSDADILQTLTNLLNSGDTNLQQIKLDVEQITNSSQNYDQFIDTMSIYQNYENLISQQLTQLDEFLTSDAAIDGQEVTLNELSSQIMTTIVDYRNIVQQNNQKAKLVNDKFNDTNSRMSVIKTISDGVNSTMDRCKDIIRSKRSTLVSSYIPVVVMPFNTQLITFTTSNLITDITGAVSGNKNLLHNLKWLENSKIIWDNTNSTDLRRDLEFKIEVLSTEYQDSTGKVIKLNPFDTQTVIECKVYDSQDVGMWTTITTSTNGISNQLVSRNRFYGSFTSVKSSREIAIEKNAPSTAYVIELQPNHYIKLFVVKPDTVDKLKINQLAISVIVKNLNVGTITL
jgi:hypothetical protein